jgi:hypothetical protein
VVGLAFLSRNDGILLGVPYALAFAWDLLRPPRLTRIGWLPALICAIGFLVVVTPWLVRQVDVFGSLSPSSIGGRILFIREYRELYSVSSETTLASFLAQGPQALIGSRIDGLVGALRVLALVPLLILLVPPLLIGAWKQRRARDFLPWSVYAAVLLAFSAIVSAVHVPKGTFLHSAVALVPHAYLLSLIGLAALVGWVAARRPTWDTATATRNLSLLVVGAVLAMSAAATMITIGAWERERRPRTDILATLARNAGPADVVMSPDAGAYRYHGGWSGIVTPDDPLPIVEATLRLYGARWLVLEKDHITADLRPVLAGEVQPRWLSAPLVSVPGTGPADSDEVGPDEPAEMLPAAALYAVCLSPADERCAT